MLVSFNNAVHKRGMYLATYMEKWKIKNILMFIVAEYT